MNGAELEKIIPQLRDRAPESKIEVLADALIFNTRFVGPSLVLKNNLVGEEMPIGPSDEYFAQRGLLAEPGESIRAYLVEYTDISGRRQLEIVKV